MLLTLLAGCKRDDESYSIQLSVPVQVEEVKKSDIEAFITATGTLEPIKEVSVKNDIEGILSIQKNNRTNEFYKEGDYVHKGDLIAILENQEFLLNNRLEAKKMEYEFAQEEVKQTESLYEKGGATLKELQNARKNRLNAKLNYENALLQEEKLKIKAQISGILTYINLTADGKEVQVGTEIAKIMNYSKVVSKLKLSLDDAQQVKKEQKVKVTNYSLEDKIFQGKVNNILPVLDPISRTVEVEVILDNTDYILKPGMFIRADIITRKKENVVVIPKHLILNRDEQDVVFTVEKQQAIMNDVKTGLESEEMVEIINGIEEGDRIVTKGYETLKDKVKVKIVK